MKDRTNDEIFSFLENLTKDDMLTIIKYGLRGWPTAPVGITVEDVYEAIGCQYISEKL